MKMKLLAVSTLSGALVLWVVASCWQRYPGNPGPFLLFILSFPAMLALGLLRPRSFVYLFFSLFLFLGFWLKFVAHIFFGLELLEPVGIFNGSPQAWDRGLMTASAVALGVMVGRGVHIAWLRERSTVKREQRVPVCYESMRVPLWAGTLSLLLLLNLWNVWAAFYQIGVNPRLVLPAHLNVVVAWFINLGFALWLAALVNWELCRVNSCPLPVLSLPVMEGVVASVSTLSRLVFLLHTLPYLVVVWQRRSREPTLEGKGKLFFAAVLALGFVVSVSLVQVGRSVIYFSPSAETMLRGAAVTTKEVQRVTNTTAFYIPQMMQQLPWLIVGRWVGLEGVLAVSSYPATGTQLLMQGVTEKPQLGNTSLYQNIAHASYRESQHFSFLTLPGIAGVLLYSGSALLVGVGLVLVTLLLISVELTIEAWLPNPFLVSVAAIAMANVVCQLNFPYLTLVFFIELAVTLVGIWACENLLNKVRSYNLL
jgi:hypothetical protein